MSAYYDRQGNPMGMEGWLHRYAEPASTRVADTWFDDCWVSTVWLGLDHNFGAGPPLIFETIVFPAKDREVTDSGDLYLDRYSTEAAALSGHERVVAAIREHGLAHFLKVAR